jgi:hypothetical protein
MKILRIALLIYVSWLGGILAEARIRVVGGLNQFRSLKGGNAGLPEEKMGPEGGFALSS